MDQTETAPSSIRNRTLTGSVLRSGNTSSNDTLTGQHEISLSDYETNGLPKYDNNFMNLMNHNNNDGNSNNHNVLFSGPEDGLSFEVAPEDCDEYLTPIPSRSNARHELTDDSDCQTDNFYEEIPVSNTHARTPSTPRQNIAAIGATMADTHTPVTDLPRRNSSHRTTCDIDSYKYKCLILTCFNVLLVIASAVFTYLFTRSGLMNGPVRNEQASSSSPDQASLPGCSAFSWRPEQTHGTNFCLKCKDIHGHFRKRDVLEKFMDASGNCCFSPCRGMSQLVTEVSKKNIDHDHRSKSAIIHVHGSHVHRLADNKSTIAWDEEKSRTGFRSLRTAGDRTKIPVEIPGYYFIYSQLTFLRYMRDTRSLDVSYNVTMTSNNGTEVTIDVVAMSCQTSNKGMHEHSLKSATIFLLEQGSTVGIVLEDDRFLYKSSQYPHEIGLIFVASPP